MIKIKTVYDNKKNAFACEYATKNTHTMEHICLLARIWLEINKNDDISDEDVYKTMSEIRKQLISEEED